MKHFSKSLSGRDPASWKKFSSTSVHKPEPESARSAMLGNSLMQHIKTKTRFHPKIDLSKFGKSNGITLHPYDQLILELDRISSENKYVQEKRDSPEFLQLIDLASRSSDSIPKEYAYCFYTSLIREIVDNPHSIVSSFTVPFLLKIVNTLEEQCAFELVFSMLCNKDQAITDVARLMLNGELLGLDKETISFFKEMASQNYAFDHEARAGYGISNCPERFIFIAYSSTRLLSSDMLRKSEYLRLRKVNDPDIKYTNDVKESRNRSVHLLCDSYFKTKKEPFSPDIPDYTAESVICFSNDFPELRKFVPLQALQILEKHISEKNDVRAELAYIDICMSLDHRMGGFNPLVLLKKKRAVELFNDMLLGVTDFDRLKVYAPSFLAISSVSLAASILLEISTIGTFGLIGLALITALQGRSYADSLIYRESLRKKYLPHKDEIKSEAKKHFNIFVSDSDNFRNFYPQFAYSLDWTVSYIKTYLYGVKE